MFMYTWAQVLLTARIDQVKESGIVNAGEQFEIIKHSACKKATFQNYFKILDQKWNKTLTLRYIVTKLCK